MPQWGAPSPFSTFEFPNSSDDAEVLCAASNSIINCICSERIIVPVVGLQGQPLLTDYLEDG